MEESPCPQIFRYENISTNKWYGSVNYTVPITERKAFFDLKLSNSPKLITINVKKNITINSDVIQINGTRILSNEGMTYKLFIIVKFDSLSILPRLKEIYLNGKQICPKNVKRFSTFETGVNQNQRIHRRIRNRVKLLSSIQSNEPSCGQVPAASPLIKGGVHLQYGQWPWHIALYKKSGTSLTYVCGGSVVSKRNVITAAHCVFKILPTEQLIVYLGKTHLSPHIEEEGQQIKGVINRIVFPFYNPNSYHGDICILTLDSQIEYSQYVRPVCIWDHPADLSVIIGHLGTYSGWGITETDRESDILKMAKIPIVSADDCVRSYPAFFSQYMSQNSFCAGFRNGTSPCNGDSGGGLMFERDSSWYLRGIISVSVGKDGQNVCDPYHYIIFTDVPKYMDFIRHHIQF